MSPSATLPKVLSQEQVSFFHDNGYLLLPDVLPQETITELLDRTHTMLKDFPLEGHPMTRFSTGDDKGEKHVGDDYFLNSGDKVRYFFEEDAFDPQGNLIKPKEKAINKIGHALHDLEPSFNHITMTPHNLSIAKSLGFRDPRVLQSMVICKNGEGIGAPVPSHQDSTFLYTDPPSAVGFWYALEDTNVLNGCLSFVPGSHKTSPICKRFVRIDGGSGGTGFVDVQGVESVEEPDEEEYVKAEVKAGTLVLIHGNVLHKSERNRSKGSRFIYTYHVVEGEAKYDELNWLQPSRKEGFSALNDVL